MRLHIWNNLCTLNFKPCSPLFIQVMVKSADKLAFITGNDKYLTGVEGSIPVLVKSVSKESSVASDIWFRIPCLWREAQMISGKLDRHCWRDRRFVPRGCRGSFINTSQIYRIRIPAGLLKLRHESWSPLYVIFWSGMEEAIIWNCRSIRGWSPIGHQGGSPRTWRDLYDSHPRSWYADGRSLQQANKGANLSLNPLTVSWTQALTGCFVIFIAGQVAEKLDKIAGVVDHGIICSDQ